MEPLNKPHAGATGCWPGMMARSKVQQIVGTICKPSDKASAPVSPVPKGWRENAASALPVSSVRSTNYDLRRPSRIHPHFAPTRSTWGLFRGSLTVSRGTTAAR
jgi:hypothetical protein